MNQVYGPDGNLAAEVNSNGLVNAYVYQGGQLLAEYTNGTTYFTHSDHLGSTRLLTGVNQSVVQNLDYLPFGEILSSDSGITTNKFTGDERDAETNLDHTWFRQYSSQLGRWMHPDPAGLAAVAPSNPQSWNRYAYVINNPTANVDPLGLDYCNGNPYSGAELPQGWNVPPPCQIAPGVWDASWVDPNYGEATTPGTPQYFQNQTWQSADAWLQQQTGTGWYTPLPTGSLNVAPDNALQTAAAEMDIGFKYIVGQIQNDWILYGLVKNALLLPFATAGQGGGILGAIQTDLDVLTGLNAWKSMSVPGVPPAPCMMNTGLAMGVWKAQLLAWIKSHPGQAPPPDIATPPNLSGVCG